MSVPVSALIGLRKRWVASLQHLPPASRMTHPVAMCVHELDKVMRDEHARQIHKPTRGEPMRTENTIYIAGPMRGRPNFNREAFYSAQANMESRGFTVYNPAANDEQSGVDLTSPDGDESRLSGFCLRTAMQENCAAICASSHILMLEGWSVSVGARVEHELATMLGLEIIYETDDGI